MVGPAWGPSLTEPPSLHWRRGVEPPLLAETRPPITDLEVRPTVLHPALAYGHGWRSRPKYWHGETLSVMSIATGHAVSAAARTCAALDDKQCPMGCTCFNTPSASSSWPYLAKHDYRLLCFAIDLVDDRLKVSQIRTSFKPPSTGSRRSVGQNDRFIRQGSRGYASQNGPQIANTFELILDNNLSFRDQNLISAVDQSFVS